eukprot:Seg2910.5 transcript_id=Seg2910.5/GoldUCD/mRNA.D3Y31 product="hypothetical protein" protein_id=Seg2910.5/GoldUCD/D3Y31
MEDRIRELTERVRVMEEENKKLKEKVNTGRRKKEIPTRVLKVAFKANARMLDGCRHAGMLILWMDLDPEIQNVLKRTVVNELKAKGLQGYDEAAIHDAVRCFYNQRRRTDKIKGNVESRRELRKRQKLHQVNYRIRQEKIKDAKENGLLDIKNAEQMSSFKKSIPTKSLEEINPPPDSDDDEGRKREKAKRINALAAGRENMRQLHSYMRRGMREGIIPLQDHNSPANHVWHSIDAPETQYPGSFVDSQVWLSNTCSATNTEITACSTPRKTNDLVTAAQVSPPESAVSNKRFTNQDFYRNWLQKPSYVDYPWDAVPNFPFCDIKAVLGQKDFDARWGTSNASDLHSLFPGLPPQVKILNHLIRSVITYVNIEKKRLWGKTLPAVNVGNITNVGETFCIKGQLVKQLERFKKIDKDEMDDIYLLMPVMRAVGSPARGSWSLAVALIEESGNKLAFLDAMGEDCFKEAEKIGYSLYQ